MLTVVNILKLGPYRRVAKWLVIVACVILAITGLGYAYLRYHFPYGSSHCCDLNLYFALLHYADDHSGSFPTGEATPEASLSLLYQHDPIIDARLLRGKSIPESIVQAILERGERLGPETCGWHYVENLRKSDDPQLGLFWDKAGLDHNGGRLWGGGHIVMFVDGRRKHIPASEWQEFLVSQQKLLDKASRRAPGYRE